jgi:hypothetical protein
MAVLLATWPNPSGSRHRIDGIIKKQSVQVNPTLLDVWSEVRKLCQGPDKRGGLNRSMQHFSKSICSVQSKLKRTRVLIQAECRPGWSS